MAATHTSINATTSDNEKKNFVIYQGNRLLIAALSFIGLLLDGYQLADLFFGFSIILWVWLPELDALEEHILNRKTHQRTTSK